MLLKPRRSLPALGLSRDRRLGERQNDAALDALRKAVESDPKALVPRKVYAYLLSFLRHDDTPVRAWRDVLELAPEDLTQTLLWELSCCNRSITLRPCPTLKLRRR